MSEFKTIDARNTFCPGPLMELITYMKQAEVGDTLELL
ncbi:MAG: sulfurtransferase TusA family protein, partial [Candidatus Thiodiazotropha endolucinida]